VFSTRPTTLYLPCSIHHFWKYTWCAFWHISSTAFQPALDCPSSLYLGRVSLCHMYILKYMYNCVCMCVFRGLNSNPRKTITTWKMCFLSRSRRIFLSRGRPMECYLAPIPIFPDLDAL
jgi:hypothetical protein